MKRQILTELRASIVPVSGETLSEKLSTSRVSVWKHIQKLQELGYDIVPGPKGYLLRHSPDTPFSWEFGEMEDRVHFFHEVGSTMDLARDLGRKGCSHLTTVVAERQTSGRGRMQRAWVSEEGGLYFTTVVKPEIPALMASRVIFLASLSLVGVLRSLFGIDARVKWPNDILVHEKKLTGILSEMEASGEMVSFVNIGMGININNDPGMENNAISLKKLIGRNVSRKEVLSAFLQDFQNRLEHANYETIVDHWKKVTMTLGRQVKIVTISAVYEGTAVDVDRDGSLILALADGKIQRVIHGDCFFPLTDSV